MLTKVMGKSAEFQAPNWRRPAKDPIALLSEGALEFQPGLNLVLGPNGAGKTAVLRYVAAMFQADLHGYSRLSEKCRDRAHDHFFPDTDSWRWRERVDEVYPHLEVSLQNNKAVEGAFYWTPGFIPGYEADFTHGMMCGFWEESRHLSRLVADKSSGQGSRAVLESLLGHVEGATRPEDWRKVCAVSENPVYSFERRMYLAALKAKELWGAGGAVVEGSTVLVILDEPDQSLDQVGQLEFWQRLDRICKEHKNVQMLVSTHSFAPLLLLASKEIEAHVVQTSNYMESSTLLRRVGAR